MPRSQPPAPFGAITGLLSGPSAPAISCIFCAGVICANICVASCAAVAGAGSQNRPVAPLMVNVVSTGAPDGMPGGYVKFNWSMMKPGAAPQ